MKIIIALHLLITPFFMGELKSETQYRAKHQNLTKFLDCELSGEQNCKLQKKKVVVEKKNPPQEDKTLKTSDKKEEKHGLYIYRPTSRKAHPKGRASSR